MPPRYASAISAHAARTRPAGFQRTCVPASDGTTSCAARRAARGVQRESCARSCSGVGRGKRSNRPTAPLGHPVGPGLSCLARIGRTLERRAHCNDCINRRERDALRTRLRNVSQPARRAGTLDTMKAAPDGREARAGPACWRNATLLARLLRTDAGPSGMMMSPNSAVLHMLWCRR